MYNVLGVDSDYKRNGYQWHLVGVEAFGVWAWQPCQIICKFWDPQPPEDLRTCPGLEYNSLCSTGWGRNH
jgi:hypothetical protein